MFLTGSYGDIFILLTAVPPAASSAQGSPDPSPAVPILQMDLQTRDPDLKYLCAWLSIITHQLHQMQRFLE